MEEPREVEVEKERENALQQLEEFLEKPMYLLAFIWLLLTVWDLVKGLPSAYSRGMMIIWITFWLDFILKFSLAAKKRKYLQRNWLTLLALLVPALRLFRVLRVFRMVQLLRGSRVIRILGSFNRGMNTLNRSLGRRGFGYVAALTVIVVLLGGAGVFAFETHYETFGGALWWSSMMITTMGSDFYPQTTEGRILAFLMAIYGFSFFGYVTATVAGLFIDRDTSELKGLREELREIKEMLKK